MSKPANVTLDLDLIGMNVGIIKKKNIYDVKQRDE